MRKLFSHFSIQTLICVTILSPQTFAQSNVSEWSDIPEVLANELGNRDLQYRRINYYSGEIRERVKQYSLNTKVPIEREAWKNLRIHSDLPKDLSAEAKDCWFALASGAPDCNLSEYKKTLRSMNSYIVKSLDLQQAGKNWSTQYGMRRSRDLMMQALKLADSDNNQIEERAIRVGKEANYVYPDSLKALPLSERKKTGIYFAYGYAYDTGLPSAMVKRSVSYAREQGFRSKAFATHTVGTSQANAKLIDAELRKELPFVDRVYLIGASKGGHELVYFFLNLYPKWSAEEQEKLHVILGLSAVVRNSYLGQWMIEDKGVRLSLIRSLARYITHEDKEFSGMASTLHDFWNEFSKDSTKKNSLQPHNNFAWINFSMIPTDQTGNLHESADWVGFSNRALEFFPTLGPVDGLVETGATVLPPDTGIRQWIVRGWGSHVTTYGVFLDGTPIASRGLSQKKAEIIESGAQSMDALLRFLPVNPESI